MDLVQKPIALAVFSLEFLHKLRQDLSRFEGQGVVGGGAQAADRAMAFEANHVLLLGFFDEGLFQFDAG